MSYMLDTNVISDLIRNPGGKAGQRIAVLRDGELMTSIIVAAEMRYGLAKRGSARLTKLVESVLADFEIVPWEAPADVRYAEKERYMRKMHAAVSLTTGALVPVAGYLINGTIGFEFIVLGAVIGVAYWYWGPIGLPF
jgi:predicted nucleic acid-binding protein